MTGDRLRTIRALFDAAAALPPVERRAFLATAEPNLRKEVERLLAAAPRGEVIFEPGWQPQPALAGRRLGRYELLRLVAAGGMGAIFEAVRPEDGVRVAIKLVRLGLVQDVLLRRFRQEQWILGRLAHPNIAELLDAGVADDGRPYLVMEYVAGPPITAWCDEQRLGLGDRLVLFQQACDAVHYAHQQGILHRDLKPDNILVAPPQGVVKLLDFGIAKLLHDEPALEAIRSSPTSRTFTPEYVSPEQIEGKSPTPASDIYSLGVILFELLTGRLPHSLPGSTLVEFTRAVLRKAVPPPSEVLTDEAAGRRGEVSSRALRKRLTGALDGIVLRALAREPARRYPSVVALSEALGPFRAVPDRPSPA